MILVARVVLDVKKFGVRDLAVDGQDCLTETSNTASIVRTCTWYLYHTRSSTDHTLYPCTRGGKS